MSIYVPLSVRHGNRRKKLGWWFSSRREAVALKLAPWLGGYRAELFNRVERERFEALELADYWLKQARFWEGRFRANAGRDD